MVAEEKHYHWTVLGGAPPKNGRKMVLCKCDCGTIKEIRYDQIKSGDSKSCGCERTKKNSTHHMTNTRLYNIWHKMKERCYNPNHVHYRNYGGRGIYVCEEWIHNFQAFYDWAINNGYCDNLTLDRKNGNEGYTPENCRWATAIEQQNNTRANRIIYAMGKSMSIARWSVETSIPYSTIYSRLCSGWSGEDAVSIPIDKKKSSRRQ